MAVVAAHPRRLHRGAGPPARRAAARSRWSRRATGLELRPGRVVLARARACTCKLERRGADWLAPPGPAPAGDAAHRPSVDVLFESAAARWGAACSAWCSPAWATTACAGARAIRAAGGARAHRGRVARASSTACRAAWSRPASPTPPRRWRSGRTCSDATSAERVNRRTAVPGGLHGRRPVEPCPKSDGCFWPWTVGGAVSRHASLRC